MLKIKNSLFFILAFLISYTVTSQNIFGKWKTIDDETGEAKSIVKIYKENGKVFGKIIDILNPENKNALCKHCEGDEKNKPVLGLVVIKNMEKIGTYYKNGSIFDPENGKKYKCRLAINNDPNILQVRGYIAFLYATQYWQRVVD